MATFTVTNLFDSGAGSFRQAIFDANAQVGVDEIIFDTSGVPSTITLTSGELNITDSVNILGAGADRLTVSGNNTSRIFNIDDGGSDIIDVLISSLTLADGYTTSSGAAILNTDENLSLVDAVITNNRAFGEVNRVDGEINSGNSNISGGGIFNDSGHLRIVNSTVSGNTAQGGFDLFDLYGGKGSGGGIFNGSGHLTIVDSTISSNTAEGGYSSGTDSAQGSGGGVFNDSGSLQIVNSTISGNRAEGFLFDNRGSGGGIFNHSGNVTMTDSTISSNTAEGGYEYGSGQGSGGGIFNDSGIVTINNSTISSNAAKSPNSLGITGNTYGGGISGKVTIVNSTISGNTAQAGIVSYVCFSPGNSYGGGIWGSGEVLNSTITGNTAIAGSSCDYSYSISPGIGIGSGIFNTDTMTITSSIVAGNTNADDIDGGFISGGNNLIGIDPLLGPLQNNGGFTETHALLSDSPAINAGSNPLGLLTDQRGSGFNRTVASQTDIGAFEVQPSTSVPEPSSIFGFIGLVILGTGSLLRRKRQNKS